MGSLANLRRFLVLAVLVAAALGVTGSLRLGAAVAPSVVSRIVVPAAAFIPTTDNWDYDNEGGRLGVVGTDTGVFSAWVSFPVPAVNIRKVTLYAYDWDPFGRVCLKLYRASPATGADVRLGEACTGNLLADPQAVTVTAIRPRGIDTAKQGLYAWVTVDPGRTAFYGVQIVYSYEGAAPQ